MTYTEENMAAAIVRSIFTPTRYNCIVNVSFGFLNHEADLLVMNENCRLYEVEIKTSLADLKADFKKKHGHEDRKVERLFYAVPTPLLEAAQNIIPEQFGIIAVEDAGKGCKYPCLYATRVRNAAKLRDYPLNVHQVIQLLRLGTMRFWTRHRYEDPLLDIMDDKEPEKKEIQLDLF